MSMVTRAFSFIEEVPISRQHRRSHEIPFFSSVLVEISSGQRKKPGLAAGARPWLRSYRFAPQQTDS
jgi:hypothetical protein